MDPPRVGTTLGVGGGDLLSTPDGPPVMVGDARQKKQDFCKAATLLTNPFNFVIEIPIFAKCISPLSLSANAFKRSSYKLLFSRQ
jgi:hypothetical protein